MRGSIALSHALHLAPLQAGDTAPVLRILLGEVPEQVRLLVNHALHNHAHRVLLQCRPPLVLRVGGGLERVGLHAVSVELLDLGLHVVPERDERALVHLQPRENNPGAFVCAFVCVFVCAFVCVLCVCILCVYFVCVLCVRVLSVCVYFVCVY